MRGEHRRANRPRPLERDQAILKEWLKYDPETGVFTWRKSPPKRIVTGQVAGSDMRGYVRIMFRKVLYLAHRLAWVYMSDQPLPAFIDHINGVKSDNRWCNLRSASLAINQQNKHKAHKNSKTGVLGVSACGRGFRAAVRLMGKNHYSQTFRTIDEASLAYVEMKRRLHPGCTI